MGALTRRRAPARCVECQDGCPPPADEAATGGLRRWIAKVAGAAARLRR